MICQKCEKEVEILWDYYGQLVCQECLETYNVDLHIQDGKLTLNKQPYFYGFYWGVAKRLRHCILIAVFGCSNHFTPAKNFRSLTMNLAEYEKVKDFTYLQYCDYLQEKYGIGLSDYMTRQYDKNPKVTRTKDGLLAHHKYEDHAIMLSNKEYAMQNPFEWQLAKNIVYCDYLEHMLLHILICEYPAEDKNEFEAVGVGGVINYLIPELNDFYSGWQTNQPWRKNCHNLIKDDKAVYLILVKRFKEFVKDYADFKVDMLFTSFNERFGLWSKAKNKQLYEEIKNL